MSSFVSNAASAFMTDDLLHGGAIDRMRKLFPDAPTPWLDLSTGINPFAYTNAKVSAEAITSLPTKEMIEACRSAMATAIGAPVESLALGPGSELLIRMLPTVITPRTAAILAPSYGDHQEVWHFNRIPTLKTSNPLAHVDTADAIVICNPNNPDGRVFDPDALENARKRLAERGGWLIIDEAYADLAPTTSLAPSGGKDGLIIFRSFGKFFGLAGLRLGAVIAPPLILEKLHTQLGIWPVSGHALEIGARAYRDAAWQRKAREDLRAARRHLDEVFRFHDLHVGGGTDLFRYIELDRAHILWKRLAQQGIYTRRFAWSERSLRFGIPATPIELERLSDALSLSM